MRKLLWVLTLILVVLMPAQWGLHLGGTEKAVTREATETLRDGTPVTVQVSATRREGGIHVTPGDALLVVVFLLWAGYVVATFRLFEIRVPFFAVFVFLALVLASAIHSGVLKPGLREFFQLSAYFIGGWLVFANCIDSRPRLKAAADVFTVVVAVIVVIALWQYRAAADGNAFEVKAGFENRNVLGAFLAFALPFVFALALYEKRVLQRFALVLTVAVGAAVTLSGGALLALAAGLLFVAALKSQKALIAVLIALALAVTVMPGMLALPRHSDVVMSSIQPFVNSNHLEITEPKRAPTETVVATRYKRWHAATRLIGSRLQWPFLGVGPGRYSENVAEYYGSGVAEKPAGPTDVVKGFNIEADEPDTFNMYLVTCAEGGPFALLALLWVGVLFLGRNLRRHSLCRDDFGKALALGAAGAAVGAAVCAIFSNVLVRGAVMPFIFVALSGILWAKLPDSPGPERRR